MKILLIKPYFTINTEDAQTYGFFPPMGLAYIASVLEQNNFTVKIIDCQLPNKKIRINKNVGLVKIGISDNEIKNIIKEFAPDVIGISINFTSFAKDALNIAKLAKATSPETIVVIGGAYATIAYQEILKNSCIDIAVLGEGEITFLELIKKIQNEESYLNIPGIALAKNEGKIITTPAREPIKNLDELPFPSYHLLKMDRYINQHDKNFAFYKAYPVGFIMSSRGCPYNCIFCSTSKFFKKYRERSAKNVVDEIEFLVETYKVKEIHFFDDCFNANRKRTESICQEIIDRQLNIYWQVGQGMAIKNIDEPLLHLMVKSGLYRIGFSLESGSYNTLKYIRKPIDLEHSLEVINLCNKLGLYTHGNFVMGFPSETKEELDKTINYIMKSNLDFINLTICQPLAGSDLYDSYKESKLLGENEQPKEGSHYLNTLYDTLYLKANELNILRKNTVRKFLIKKILQSMTPQGFKIVIYPKITSIDKILFFLKIAYNTLKLIILRKNIA